MPETCAGDLTATLQAPGLQVGDEVEFAATTKRRDPTLGEHSQGGMALPATEMAGAYRMRLTWPKGRNLAWRATPDLGALMLDLKVAAALAQIRAAE